MSLISLQPFFSDTRTLTLFALIAVDLVLGICAALRTQTFAWRAVGRFYETNVLPYLLGYGLIYFIGTLGVAPLLGPLWADVVATVGVGPAVASLAASIATNLATVRRGPVPPWPPDMPR